MKEIVKIVIILVGYLGVAPLAGVLMQSSRRWQRAAFALLVFMTSWHVSKLTLTLGSIEWYRGHTKGFEFSLFDMVAIALLVATFLGPDRPRRWLAPGTVLYLLYIALSCVSVFAAPNQIYVAMAALKFGKAVLIFLTAFHFLREEKDLSVFLKALAVSLLVQVLVVMKLRYVNHIYQVNGWFEHQNSLGMWAYLCGLPLLATAMGPASRKDTAIYLLGFAASLLITLASLSRGSLAAMGAGIILVMAISLAERFTIKRALSIAGVAVLAAAAVLAAFSTLKHRFSEDRNQASAASRIALNQSAAGMLADSPIGKGWNNFALVMNPPYSYGQPFDDWQRSRGFRVDPTDIKPLTENHYWLLLGETGYAGLIGYLLFITVTGWWCMRGAWVFRHTVLGAFLIGLFVALLVTYAHSSLERVLTQTKNLTTWLIFLGVVARIEMERRSARRSTLL